MLQALKIDEHNKKAVFREAQARIGSVSYLLSRIFAQDNALIDRLGEIQAGKKILTEMNKKQPGEFVLFRLTNLGSRRETYYRCCYYYSIEAIRHGREDPL